jgi:prophage tail gpP-like protein
VAAPIGGNDNDAVQIRLGDEDVKKIVASYEVKIGLLQVPGAFALRLGWAGQAIELLNKAVPGTPFELWVGPRRLLTGKVDARGVPTASSTEVEIHGRDHLATLFDAYVEEEQEFTERTYFDLTRKVLDLAGLTEAKGHYLQAFNDANRRLLTGSKIIARAPDAIATELLTGSLGGTGDLVFETPKTKVGERYYDFLTRQLKLAGLFLWCSPDKTFVLAAPNADQAPSYLLYRSRSTAAAEENTNVLDCRFQDDATMRHSQVEVFGRSGGGKRGIETCSGVFSDDEILNFYKFTKRLVIHDADVKNREQSEFVARRIISQERRAGWQLEYTVAGHTVFSADADDNRATWGPDTVVQVEDEQLGISGPHYIEAVTYSRHPHTTTRLTLMRPTDLLFATALAPEQGGTIVRKLKVPRGKTVR